MNLFINMPAYYTQECGVIDDIYRMCMIISRNIDVMQYTDSIETIGITPIIVPLGQIDTNCWEEVKRVSIPYKMASISLRCNYDDFCKGTIDQKKDIILNNIFESLQIIKQKLGTRFDYDRMVLDIQNTI